MSSIRSASWAALACVCLTCAAQSVDAGTLPITWLDLSSVPVGGTIASGSMFTLPGYGNVYITHTDANIWTRAQNPAMQNCSVSLDGNSYPWTALSTIDQLNTASAPGILGTSYVGFQFLGGTIPAGHTVLEVHGLGRLVGAVSNVTVYRYGTFLGDCDAGMAPTQFTNNVVQFHLYNSVVNNMDTNPGIVRIEDPILFGQGFTLEVASFGGESLGFTVGVIADAAVGTDGSTWGRLKTLYR